MSKRSKQESLLLGVVAGTAVSFGIIIPIVLLAVFGGEDVGTNAQPAPATVTAVQDGANNATRGRGGPPEGRGPGSGHDEGADPTSEGIASVEVLAAFNTGGCTACHTIKGVGTGAADIGPNLSRIGAIAGERRPGATVESYIEESIRTPNAFIMPNCPTGPCPADVMPQSFAETLTESEISTIVNYLAALGTDAEASVLTVPTG